MRIRRSGAIALATIGPALILHDPAAAVRIRDATSLQRPGPSSPAVRQVLIGLIPRPEIPGTVVAIIPEFIAPVVRDISILRLIANERRVSSRGAARLLKSIPRGEASRFRAPATERVQARNPAQVRHGARGRARRPHCVYLFRAEAEYVGRHLHAHDGPD